MTLADRKDFVLENFEKQFRDLDNLGSPSQRVSENPQHPLAFPILALNEEAGEVAGILKKSMRDNDGIITIDAAQEMAEELGDILWYLDLAAHILGFNLVDIMRINNAKLEERYRGAKQIHEGGVYKREKVKNITGYNSMAKVTWPCDIEDEPTLRYDLHYKYNNFDWHVIPGIVSPYIIKNLPNDIERHLQFKIGFINSMGVNWITDSATVTFYHPKGEKPDQ